MGIIHPNGQLLSILLGFFRPYFLTELTQLMACSREHTRVLPYNFFARMCNVTT